MKKNKAVLFSAAAVGLGIFTASGLSFFNFILHRRKPKNISSQRRRGLTQMKINHPRHQFEKEYEEGKAWCKSQPMQDCFLTSFDGLPLHGCYLPAEHPARTLLLCHGYRGSGFGDFAYTARFLHENGCNLLFIDQRCCGKSGGTYITFGAKEQIDVQRWVWYLAGRNRARLPLYLYGTSMGATSVLLAAGRDLPPDVRGIIVDGGFRSMRSQIQSVAKNWFHLHWIGLLLFRMEVFCRLLAGFRMEETDTAHAVQANRRPILFFHGEEDTYVPPENTHFHYNLTRAPKEMVLVPGARHLCGPYQAPALVREKLLAFFSQYDKQDEQGKINKNNDPPL